MNVLALLVQYLNGAYSPEFAPERKRKMKTKHTRGPWILNGKSPSGSAVICRGPEVGWNIALALPTAIPGNDTMESNAILIAAAPDLLALAKLVLESQTWDGNDPNEERWVEFYSNARKAVAKAEGKG